MIQNVFIHSKKKNNSGYIHEFIWLRDAYPLRLRTLEKSATSNLELINFLNGELYPQKNQHDVIIRGTASVLQHSVVCGQPHCQSVEQI